VTAGAGLPAPGKLKNGADRLPGGVLYKSAGIDDDDTGRIPVCRQGKACTLKHAQHDLAVHKIFGAAKAHKMNAFFFHEFILFSLCGRIGCFSSSSEPLSAGRSKPV
jgi:hypothetical protein